MRALQGIVSQYILLLLLDFEKVLELNEYFTFDRELLDFLVNTLEDLESNMDWYKKNRSTEDSQYPLVGERFDIFLWHVILSYIYRVRKLISFHERPQTFRESLERERSGSVVTIPPEFRGDWVNINKPIVLLYSLMNINIDVRIIRVYARC
jgi:hypothetical protein